MTDLHEAISEAFATTSSWNQQLEGYVKQREWKWSVEHTIRRGQGTGYRGPAVEVRKQTTRKRNLNARRAANAKHYANTNAHREGQIAHSDIQPTP